MYILFQLPLGSSYDHEGTGGGAGIGYLCEPGGPGAWMSLDGETWMQLHPDYRLAVEPILGEPTSGTVQLERATDKALAGGGEVVPLVTELMPPSPNPFNPRAKIQFSLERAGKIDLSVYDIRGRKKLLRWLAESSPRACMSWSGVAGMIGIGRPPVESIWLGLRRVARSTLSAWCC